MLTVHSALTAAGALVSGLFLLSLVFASAGGYGWRLRKLLPVEELTPLERLVFCAALGFGCISLLTTFSGVLNGWTPTIARIILVAGLLVSIPFLKQLRSADADRSLWRQPPFFFIGLSALWALLLGLAPITYYDSLVYHFALASAYLQAHHWIPLKELIYSAFPQNLEMLWTFGLLVANDHLANLIGFCLAVLTAAGVFAFGRRYFSAPVGLSSAALLTAMPSFLLLSSGGYVDVGLTLYSFFSFYALCLWMDHPRTPTLIAAGLFAGFATGIKYTGAIPAAIGAVFIVYHYRKNGAQAAKSLALYTLTAVLVMSPWLIKNLHFVGNPVFPFFYQWGNPKLSPWVQGAADGYFRGVAEYQPRTWLQLLTLPWDIAVRSVHFGGGMDILGDFGWMPFILLIPCLAFCKTPSPVARRLIAYCGLFIIPWALSRPVLRFLMPLAPVLAILSGRAWTQGVRRLSPVFYFVGFPVLGFTLLFGYLIFFYVIGLISPFNVPLGLEARDHYLERKLNYYAAAQFVNRTPAVTRVFILGDQRSYYYNKPVMVTPVFNQNPFITWANDAATPDDLALHLRMLGFSHILVNVNEMQRLMPYNIFDFTPHGLENWNHLRAQLSPSVYHDTSCEILAL